MSAKRTTFVETWVVDNIVVTHFRKPMVGFASGNKGCDGNGVDRASSTRSSVWEDSNQNRQVI